MTNKGEKQLTVTVKQVADMMVAALVAGKQAGYPESAVAAMITTIMMLFEDYNDDILEYLQEKEKEEACRLSFLKAIKESGIGMN